MGFFFGGEFGVFAGPEDGFDLLGGEGFGHEGDDGHDDDAEAPGEEGAVEVDALLAFDEIIECPGEGEAGGDGDEGGDGIGTAPEQAGAEDDGEWGGDEEEDILHFDEERNAGREGDVPG